jgi:hypothetical protein
MRDRVGAWSCPDHDLRVIPIAVPVQPADTEFVPEPQSL